MKRVIKERDFKLPSLDGGGTVATTAAANKSRLGAFDTGDEGDNYNFVQGGKKKADVGPQNIFYYYYFYSQSL
jgi:hypothetical protein